MHLAVAGGDAPTMLPSPAGTGVDAGAMGEHSGHHFAWGEPGGALFNSASGGVPPQQRYYPVRRPGFGRRWQGTGHDTESIYGCLAG
jgi:hypothetical protein